MWTNLASKVLLPKSSEAFATKNLRRAIPRFAGRIVSRESLAGRIIKNLKENENEASNERSDPAEEAILATSNVARDAD